MFRSNVAASAEAVASPILYFSGLPSSVTLPPPLAFVQIRRGRSAALPHSRAPMSTCSTTMSAPRGRRDLRDLRRRLFCDDDQAAGRQLETWLMDRDACKAGRSGAPHHRRSRSATGTPSSAVTAAGPDAGLSASLSCSPRCLVYWLQHQDGGGGAVSVKRGNITGYHLHEEDDQSSVCSVLQVLLVPPPLRRPVPRLLDNLVAYRRHGVLVLSGTGRGRRCRCWAREENGGAEACDG
jgi:hypothetical protein